MAHKKLIIINIKYIIYTYKRIIHSSAAVFLAFKYNVINNTSTNVDLMNYHNEQDIHCNQTLIIRRALSTFQFSFLPPVGVA